MSRITVSEAAEQFKVSRPTIYKKIKAGELTKDSNGLLDKTDCIRVLTTVKTSKNVKAIDVNNDMEKLKVENEALHLQIVNLKKELDRILQQLNHAQNNETWLKQQIEQLQPKKIEHKKGLIGRLFS